MGKIRDWLQKRLLNEPEKPTKAPTLSEIIDTYDIIDVVTATDEHGPFLVVSERTSKTRLDASPDADNFQMFSENVAGGSQSYPPVVSVSLQRGPISLKEPDYSEIGSSSPSPYTAFIRNEYNQELVGLSGMEKYQKMRSDGVISGTMLMFKTPVHAGRWFIEPSSDEELDEEVAKFIWNVLTEYQTTTWTQIKSEALLMCEFGYFMLEKVWVKRKIDGKNRLVLQKLAPRHPMDVKEWTFDKHGGPEYVTMYVGNSDNSGAVDEKKIHIEKLLVFTMNREGGDIRGRSVLRAAYKHWYYKEQLYKIDAIQKERHGIGVPVIKLPPNNDEKDRILANEIGRNLRTNERAHVVLPPMWEILFAKLEGQPVDVIASIEMHDKAIRENILASFMGSDTTTKEEDLSLFLKATRFVADSMCDVFNLYLIPELVKYNFGKDVKPPKLRVRRIGEQADWRVQSFAIRNMVGAGIIRPDDRLEKNVREEMDLPRADITTTRVVAAPQAGQAPPPTTPNATPGAGTNRTDGSPDKPGLPRQAPVPAAKLPNASSGNDKGGQS